MQFILLGQKGSLGAMGNNPDMKNQQQHQLLPSDLLISQMEVTFSPLKITNQTPKRVTRKNLDIVFFLK